MKDTKIEELLEKTRREGEVFLGSFSSEELKNMDFEPIWGTEEEFFSSFEFVDIYLIHDGEQYKFKYVIDGDPRYEYYDTQEELGKYFLEVLEEYIKG